MQNLIYMAVVGLAVLLTLKVAGLVLATLFPLVLLAAILFVPVAMVMAVGWVVMKVLGGFRREGAAGH